MNRRTLSSQQPIRVGLIGAGEVTQVIHVRVPRKPCSHDLVLIPTDEGRPFVSLSFPILISRSLILHPVSSTTL